MSSKRKYDRNDYLKMLEHNVRNAVSVAHLFDKGVFESSTLLIGIIRLLVHDTNSSISLLKRLDDKNAIYFLDTSIDYPPDTFHLQNFLFGAHVRKVNEEEHFQSLLPKFYFEDDHSKTVSFDDWWEKIVIILHGNNFSRKDIILITAHKHGILHSDDKVDAVYYDLANNVLSFAYHTETMDIENPDVDVEPIDNTLYSLIRQISHELILTLVNYYDLDIDYSNIPDDERLSVAMGPIFDLSIAIDPEFHEAHKDIVRTRKADN